MDKRVCSNCRCRPAGFDTDLCWPCERKLYDCDEEPPDLYNGMSEDERLDDPRHGQAEEINRRR